MDQPEADSLVSAAPSCAPQASTQSAAENVITKQGAGVGLRRRGHCAFDPNDRRFRHGMSSTRIYKLWAEMKARCENPDNAAWKAYGGRGIKVCQRWSESFHAFYDDFGRLRPDGTTIDRIENNKGYEPGNVRWATDKEQARNRRSNRLLTAFGETKTVIEWAEDPRCKITWKTFRGRIDRGWDAERALTAPLRKVDTGWRQSRAARR